MGVRRSEHGHLMVGLMAAVALMVIFSAVAVQAWEDILRRDLEAEMMFRAQEIVRALRRYEKDQGHPATELKQLMEPGNRRQYFLRRLYKDPLVKGGKWGLLYKTPEGGLLDPNLAGVTEDEPISGGSNAPTTGLPGGPTLPTPGGGQELTGLPIAGVKSLCKDRPFKVYKGQSDYSLWLFSIFDLEVQNAPVPGQKPGTPPVKGKTSAPPGSPQVGPRNR